MVLKAVTIGILLCLPQSFVICEIWEPPNIPQKVVCRRDVCLKRANLYFENLNPTVNPCDDFYSFACGTWYIPHKPPEYAAEWTVHDIMEKRLLEDLREILEKPVSNPDLEFKQVKYFYDICVKQPFYGKNSPSNVSSQIIRAGRFGKKRLWDIHQAYLKLTGESAFFDYNTYALRPEQFVPILIMRDVTSPYGVVHQKTWKPEEEENYEQFLFELIKNLNLPGTNIIRKTKIKAVVKFRHQFNEIVLQTRKRKEISPKLMSIQEFDQWFKGFGTGSTKKSGMPWARIVKRILSVMPKAPKTDLQIITVHRDGYFRELNKLLSTTTEEVLVDHMEMYFAERHMVFTAKMEELVESTSIEPTDLMEHMREETPRWETCIKNHNMWASIAKILQDQWFKKNITAPMTDLVDVVKLAIANQIRASTWLETSAKANTIKRIIKVQPWIGYPPLYENDLSTDINSDIESNDPMRAEAYLNLQKHVICRALVLHNLLIITQSYVYVTSLKRELFILIIKSPLLRPPYFDPDLPDVYNYGAIGFVVGHELYHVINECGMHVSRASRDRWWSSEMRDRCYKQIKCFTDAYKNETQREFLLKYHETIKMPDKKTYLEDYPDVMGLDAAFRAYQSRLIDPSACLTLPRFEKYTCEQMFFISFANTLCGKVTSKTAAKHHIETSGHSLDSVRVNGAVRNSEFFQKAFHCSQDKPMNPPVKCNLWK